VLVVVVNEPVEVLAVTKGEPVDPSLPASSLLTCTHPASYDSKTAVELSVESAVVLNTMRMPFCTTLDAGKK